VHLILKEPMKRHNNLIDKITNQENIRLAYEKTAKGKKSSLEHLIFREYLELNLKEIREELITNTWTQDEFRKFTVYEPKPRLISAPSFKDRVVHHAVVNIIGPIFEKTFLPYSFACRRGYGTHRGVKHIQSLLRKHNCKYFLKTDYSKFFPSINIDALWGQIIRKIKCKETLNLIKKILGEDKCGLPIGSLTSQLFANVYGNVIDGYIHNVLKVKHWARYMDDIVILSDCSLQLRQWKELIEDYSNKELNLRLSKWNVSSVNKGINFLGYRIWSDYKLIRKQSVKKAKKKIKHLQESKDHLDQFVAAWKGHCSHADTANLFNSLAIS